MYQNGYLHGSRSRAKSAIYTAAGCQHQIVIYTAAVPEQILIYTRLPCVYMKWLFTRQPFKSQISYIHGSRVSASNCYTHGSRSRANFDVYTAAVCLHEMVIYTAVVKELNRLYTRLPCVLIKLSFTRQYFRAKSAINMATGCLCQIKCCHISALYAAPIYKNKFVIFTAAVCRENRLLTYPPNEMITRWKPYSKPKSGTFLQDPSFIPLKNVCDHPDDLNLVIDVESTCWENASGQVRWQKALQDLPPV